MPERMNREGPVVGPLSLFARRCCATGWLGGAGANTLQKSTYPLPFVDPVFHLAITVPLFVVVLVLKVDISAFQGRDHLLGALKWSTLIFSAMKNKHWRFDFI